MLSIILIIPIIGSFIIIMIESDKKNESRIKKIALSTTIINFIISLIIWGEFDSSVSDYQFTQEFNKVDFCHFNIGIDGISLYFVLLTTFIIPISILSNWDNIKYGIKYFIISFLILETLQIAVFVVLDIILFYIFFESVLIPLFIIVGCWGGSSNKIRAAFLLFLYTLIGSLFILLSFIVIYYNVGSTDFTIISLSDISFEAQIPLWLGIFVSIAVKSPIWPAHLWLVKAHTEAPLGGSVVLAAIILKLATYGYIRIILQILPDASYYFSPIVNTLCIISLIYSSLVTIRQTDIKSLVAYSSIGHIAIVIIGIFSNTVQGIEGAIILAIAHGFVSPALFILVGGVLYDRFHTRVIKYYRGITSYIPIFSILFFIFTICNAAVPLSINWIGEIMSITGIIQTNIIAACFAASCIVLSATYSIWMFNRISFGHYSQYLSYVKDINRREFFTILPLLIITFLFGFFPNIILDTIHISVSNVLYSLFYTLLLFIIFISPYFT